MSARLQSLLRELKDRGANGYLRCPHGGVLYPPSWFAKTREKAVLAGVLSVCSCVEKHAGYEGWLFLIVKGEKNER